MTQQAEVHGSTSDGRICASPSSGSCWRRRRPRVSCAPRSRRSRRASGAIPPPASLSASASPPSSAGTTAPRRSAAIRSACCAASCARCRAAARDERRRAPGRAGAIRRAQELERPAPSRQSRRAGRDAGPTSGPCRPTPRCAVSSRRTASTSGGASHHARPPAPSVPRRGSFDREVRSYEAAYVNGLWHWDCHYGSRKVLTARGEWHTPVLFGVLDDRSRLACHLQWYLAETAETIAHGLSQAFQKRGLPRSGAERQRRGDDRRRDHRGARPGSASCIRPRCPTAPTRMPSRRRSGGRSRAG